MKRFTFAGCLSAPRALVLIALALMPHAGWAQTECSQTNPAQCYYVGNGQQESIQPTAFANASPACQSVANNCGADIMVPTSSQAEWTSFINDHEQCATLSDCNSYAWVAPGGWGACSASCGGGMQTRSLSCQKTDIITNSVTFVDPGYCGSVSQPPTSQACNTQACPAVPQYAAVALNLNAYCSGHTGTNAGCAGGYNGSPYISQDIDVATRFCQDLSSGVAAQYNAEYANSYGRYAGYSYPIAYMGGGGAGCSSCSWTTFTTTAWGPPVQGNFTSSGHCTGCGNLDVVVCSNQPNVPCPADASRGLPAAIPYNVDDGSGISYIRGMNGANQSAQPVDLGGLVYGNNTSLSNTALVNPTYQPVSGGTKYQCTVSGWVQAAYDCPAQSYNSYNLPNAYSGDTSGSFNCTSSGWEYCTQHVVNVTTGKGNTTPEIETVCSPIN